MKQTKLAKLLAEIEQASSLAEIVPESGDPRSRAGREILKAAAERSVARAISQFNELVLESAIFIAPLGDNENVAIFSEIAQEADVLVMDGASLYRDLAEVVLKSFGGRDSGVITSTQENLVILELRDIMSKLDIADIPSVTLMSGVAVNGYEELVSFLRDSLQPTLGVELSRLYLENILCDMARTLRYTENVVPVLVTGLSENEVAGLSSVEGTGVWPLYAANVNTTPTKATVMRALTRIRNKHFGEGEVSK